MSGQPGAVRVPGVGTLHACATCDYEFHAGDMCFSAGVVEAHGVVWFAICTDCFAKFQHVAWRREFLEGLESRARLAFSPPTGRPS